MTSNPPIIQSPRQSTQNTFSASCPIARWAATIAWLTATSDHDQRNSPIETEIAKATASNVSVFMQ